MRTNKLAAFIMSATLTSSLVSSAWAAAPRPGPGSPPTLALANVPKLAAENLPRYGLKSLAEASTVTLDADSLPVYLLRLDSLRGYHAGQDPMSLLTDLSTARYLVQVASQTRSSVELTLVGSTWTPSVYGDAATAQLLDSVRTSVARAEDIALSSFMEVRAPGLHSTMLAYQGPRGLVFVPLATDASLGFIKATPVPATVALPKLQSAAAATDALAR